MCVLIWGTIIEDIFNGFFHLIGVILNKFNFVLKFHFIEKFDSLYLVNLFF